MIQAIVAVSSPLSDRAQKEEQVSRPGQAIQQHEQPFD
jgi:hypothetical protein